MKTSELTSAALDWAVAKCEGATDFWFDTVCTHWVKLHGQDRALRYGWAQSYLPSTDWAQGGPIIEREGISVLYRTGVRMTANINGQYEQSVGHRHKGDIGLLVAMRCYVASKMGDEIDIPEELK